MKARRSSQHRLIRLTAGAALALLLCAQFPALLPKAARATAASDSPSHAARKTRAQVSYGKLPLSFEANRGQFDVRIKFVSRQRGFALALTTDGAMIGAVRMRMIGANAQARITGADELPGKAHYFLGNDPPAWRTDVPTYGAVKYEAVYPGVDLIFYGNGRQLEYDFRLAPGADPHQIKLDFAGARRLRLDANGDLILQTHDGELRQHKPVAYQEANGNRREVAARYVVTGNQVRFALGAYDAQLPLVIDPVLSYSTFLGGNESDVGAAIAVDAEGNAYITGSTAFYPEMFNPFPTTTGAAQPRGDFASGTYAFVTKLNAQGSAIIYSAIIGGTQAVAYNPMPNRTEYLFGNEGAAIAVDAQGNAYVTGWTVSTNFPTTPGALQPQRLAVRDGQETFVLKLNAQGSALSYSTLAGNGKTLPYGIAVDAQGQAWITGNTQNRSFPTTADAFQRTIRNGGNSAFVVKLNATGTGMLYATYLSSGSGETGVSVALDANGNVYVGGTTGSSCARNDGLAVEPFPTTAGAFRRDLGEGCIGPGSSSMIFAVKFQANGQVVYSTLLGVGGGGRIAADAQGNAYITGQTVKLYDFPTTAGAWQRDIIGPQTMPAAVVTKLNPTGSALVYSTYLNGAAGAALAIDAAGNAYVTGALSAFTFVRTTTAAPFDAVRGVFVTKLNAAGSAADYSVILGQGNSSHIAVDARGDAYITGHTQADDFPTTPGAFQRQRRNAASYLLDAFVAKISEGSQTFTTTHVSAADYNSAQLAADSIIAAFGSRLATATQTAVANPLPTTLAGTVIKVRDSQGVERAAPLFFVSPSQVNYVMPTGTANGAATITITGGDGTVATANVPIEPIAPALFAADASGRGLAAAVALRIKATGEQSYEPIAQYDAAQQRMTPLPINLAAESEEVFLILYGTGLRRHAGLSNISARIGGVDAQVLYAGAQGDFVGLDQVNVRLSRALVGRGEADIILSVDGKTANTVKVWIR